MESLYAWREFKARQENEKMRRENRVSSATRCVSYMDMPMPSRAIAIARCRFLALHARKRDENLEHEISCWFSHLKETMKEYRLSKEYLADFGLVWNDCKNFAYGK